MQVPDKPRLHFSGNCFCDSRESSFSGQFHNLSLGGAYIGATQPFPVGYRFGLRFALSGEWITTPCVVCHVNPGAGMGVKFLSLSHEHRELLVRYLSRVLKRLGDSAYAKKRAASRLAARIPVTISGTDATGRPFEEETETINVSERGACIRLRQRVLAGSTLKVRTSLGTRNSTADFRVVWVNSPPSATESFVGLTVTALDLWRSWNLPAWQQLEGERFPEGLQPEFEGNAS